MGAPVAITARNFKDLTFIPKGIVQSSAANQYDQLGDSKVYKIITLVAITSISHEFKIM